MKLITLAKFKRRSASEKLQHLKDALENSNEFKRAVEDNAFPRAYFEMTIGEIEDMENNAENVESVKQEVRDAISMLTEIL